MSAIWLDLDKLPSLLIETQFDNPVQYRGGANTVSAESKPVRLPHLVLGFQKGSQEFPRDP